jgi:fatty-acyl-CoA synthase
MNAHQAQLQGRERAAVSAAWVRALELTTPIAKNPSRILADVIEERAAELGDAPALLSDRECFSYRELDRRSNQYARWALEQNLTKGDTVCLLMPNRPEYMAAWLGISKVGGVVALLNTHLAGSSLAYCINLVTPKHIIIAAELLDRSAAVLPEISSPATVWVHGASNFPGRRIDADIERQSGDSLRDKERRQLTVEDRALCVYTSGTTGWPNAANISHGRLMQWSHWFAGMMDTRSSDRMYLCLPMYHSGGGLVAPGAALVGKGSVVIRERFSPSHFWDDVTRWNCTQFQYIGELCRYLLHAGPSPHETKHSIRLACGNGLRPDVWEPFQKRFRIPRIFEFYAATEGTVSLFNVEGEPGSIGRIPPYLAQRFPTTLIKYDIENDVPLRNEQGFCIRCSPNETGEAIAPFLQGPSHVGNRFEGYVNSKSSDSKLIGDVFKSGDTWYRTGDMMRKDERGFFYFVDRVGDTFRWKGENVSTSEVAETISAFIGVRHVNVFGVTVPFADGRAGMAALVLDGEIDLPAFRAYLSECLPRYASPLFLRIQNEMEATATFKYTKANLVRQGFDPTATTDPIYFNHPDRLEYVRLDESLYNQIQSGQVRL